VRPLYLSSSLIVFRNGASIESHGKRPLERQIVNDVQVLSDPNESSEKLSVPPTWVRQHGAKHRDFSASRLQVRERARLRVQLAIQEERKRAREQARNWRAAGLTGTVDDEHDSHLMPEAGNKQPVSASAQAPFGPEQQSLSPISESATVAPSGQQDRKEPAFSPELPNEPIGERPRPDWFGPRTVAIAGYSPQAPADTLQGVRDRFASRWFGLNGAFEDVAAPEPLPEPASRLASATPLLAVFSLAGGVGKTSLVATLARTLSSRGERVLLVETTPFGLLPCFFGARDRRPGVLRTFSPPEGETGMPVQMVALNADALAPEPGGDDPLAAEIVRCAQTTGRVIVDIATASAAVARRVLRLAPTILVPVVPDMNSVVNTGFIDCLFHRKSDGPTNSSEVYYVLNQFDPSLPLHLDVREVLRERLGDRLLPFALRHTPAISEALAQGMTVLDYAPASQTAEEFNSLAAWVKARSVPAGAARGKRWMEK
jgi:cellulose synthase operon protein YhjQ